MISALFTKAKAYIAAAGVFLAVLVGAYLKGRSDQTAMTNKSLSEERTKALKKANEVKNEIIQLNDDDVDRRLSKWMRDK